MEAESTTSSLGAWKKKTDMPDYGGECHLEFTGNTPEIGPPKSPLKYSFRIDKDGHRFEIAISSLSEEDQTFLKDWVPE